MDNRKQRTKLSQQPVTVKFVAPSTVQQMIDLLALPKLLKTKMRTMIYQNWLTNEVRILISLIWGMFQKKREVNLFTENVESQSEWFVNLILVKQKDWKPEFFQPYGTMSKEQHLHTASLLDRTSMAGFRKKEPDQPRFFQVTSSAILSPF